MDLTQQMFFSPIFYVIVLVLHILASCVAVGAVAVTDYLHLVGLKRHKIEKKVLFVYPFLSQVINIALGMIILTGILLVINRPELLYKSLFQLKMAMVVVVTINGIILQRVIAPHMERLVAHDLPFSDKMLLQCSLCGAISVVSWFSILILALTKTTGYTWNQFLPFYLIAIVVVFTVAQFFERKVHGAHGNNKHG